MADRETWRKNLPEDFQGKMGENWDDEIHVAGVYWSAVAVAAVVAVAFVLCWFMMGPPLDYFVEEPRLSPLAEANERQLPPQPWLQPKPEVEMDELLEQMAEATTTYGWTDELNGVVRIPVDRAMDLVTDSLESAPATVEPTEEAPVDVETSDEASETESTEPAEGEANG